MTGAANISSACASHTAPQPGRNAVFSLSGICQSLRNSLAMLSSNHQLPRTPAEGIRQALSNVGSYFRALAVANPRGIEAPPLAAAQLLTMWLLSLLQKQAIGKATRQLPGLLRVSANHPDVNNFIYRLNTLVLAVSTADDATRALQWIDAYVASRREWLCSLKQEERDICHTFVQQLRRCLEKMTFWQPRSTLLLPLLNRLAPWISVYLDINLPALTFSTATPHPTQRLNASAIIDTAGPDTALRFKSVINLPGDVAQPALRLRQGQSICLRVPKCPSGIVQPADNQTAAFAIAGIGIENNLATRVCVSNEHLAEIEINRALNRATAGYPTAFYRHPWQIAGLSEPVNNGVCCAQVPPAAPAPLAAPYALREKVSMPASGWHLLPLVGAQEFEDASDLDPFGPMAPYDDWPFYEYDEETTPAEIPPTPTPMSRAQVIDYEINLFERDKKILIPFTFPTRPRTTATTARTSALPPAVTQDSMTRLFGPSEQRKPQGSCRITQPPLVARDLSDMLIQAQQWLGQLPATRLDDKIHACFTELAGTTQPQWTPLEEVVFLCKKLVITLHQRCAFDDQPLLKLVTRLFEGSRFAQNKEVLHAWINHPEGKQQVTDILIERIDRLIPDPGKLLSATFSNLMTVIRPESTSFAALNNILIDLQNSFKNNLLASVINTDYPLPAFLESETVIAKLQFLYVEFVKNHFPCFRLINKEDISAEIVLSPSGVLLSVGAGIIANEDKLNNLSIDKLKQFGMQTLLRFSEDYLLNRFSRFDSLLQKGTHRLCDYLNLLEAEGGLLVHALYLNNKIYHQIQSGGEQVSTVKADYQKLVDIEGQLCALALNQIPAVDQDFFLAASKEPQGLEIHFITSENASDRVKIRHFIGFVITADFERIRRCYFISEIPALNNFAAPLAYDDSGHYNNKDHYARWINNQGKNAFVARLSAQGVHQLSQTTFFVGDKKNVPGANYKQNWHFYMQNLSQNIARLRFPELITVPTSAPGVADAVLNFSGNLIMQFIPIESCKQALDDILDQPDTAKKALLTLEDAATCLYDASPEGESSKLVKFAAYVARSVVGKITENIRAEIKNNAGQASLHPPGVVQLEEQMYLQDSQVKNYLANSTLFHSSLSWMLSHDSLNLRPLPSRVKILDVQWNTITDQIYCQLNTAQGVKNYRVDQKNFLLLPTRHATVFDTSTNQELNLDVNNFLSHIESNTLNALKTERLEQDMRVLDKYGVIYFKKEFAEIDFNTANITETFFNNLITPPGWRPVRLWVKKDDGDTIITEWKDDKNRIQFHQLSEFNDFFRTWRGDPIDRNSMPVRATRDISTKAPFYTDMLSPLTYGYMALNPHEDHQRKTAMQALIKQGNKLPDPPHFAEITCRKMMKELAKNLPIDFIRGKFPAASEFIDKFAKWETAATIDSGFKKFSRAIEIYHAMYPEEETFYPKADKIIKELKNLDRKIKTYQYQNRAFKDSLEMYYKDYPEREIKVNLRINKILDGILPPDIPDEKKYSLKTKNKHDFEKKYPAFFQRLSANINELHSQARMVSNLFNNNLHPKLMGDILTEFTGKIFTAEEVRSFTSDFRRLQNNILAVTPDRFRIFEERFAKNGQLVAGCFKDDAEKLFFSPGDIAFTTFDDQHKHIYTQKIPNDDIFKQVAIHETGHINNGLDYAYTPPEVYIESYNLMKKFSFRGIEEYGKELLSDRGHMVEYLMRDTEFLERFCDQLSRYTTDAIHRIKIGEFRYKYLGLHAARYRNRFSDESEEKRKELKQLMDIGYNNHQFLLYFIKQNADFMVSIWHRVAEQAYEYLAPNQEIDKDALIKFDLLKSLVFKAGAAIFDEINAGASHSHNQD